MNFNEKIQSMKGDIIKSTQEIIKIKSVKGEAKPGMPFGEGIEKCLEHVLNLSEELGFKTKNVNHYGGYAEFGNGNETLGVLVHLDVVPEGDGWSYPPYSGEIHNGKIFGRGATDDKGPAIAVLYAMKAIKDSGIKLNKKIRIIFGIDEESGWESIKYYLKHEDAPDIAFTPDADFPVIYGEKGILIFNFHKSFKKDLQSNGIKVLQIKGGNRPNMVPDYCEAHIISSDSLKEKIDQYTNDKNGIMEVLQEENKTIIKSYGVSAHGSLPETGCNAVSQLMVFLDTLELADGDISEFIRFYSGKIGMNYHGESMGCGFEDKESGKLIFNVGVIDLDKEGFKLSINIRYPVTYNDQQVFNGIKRALIGTGINIIEDIHMEPIFMAKDHKLIQELMRVYKEFTNDEREPITIGGGTYARAIKNAVAFGPNFPDEPILAHQKNEYISINNLIKITKMYAAAIYNLAK